MGLIEKLNVTTEMHYCLNFCNSGKEMASALNVAVTLAVMRPSVEISPRPRGYYGVSCSCDNRPIESLTKDSGELGGRFTVKDSCKIYPSLIMG